MISNHEERLSNTAEATVIAAWPGQVLLDYNGEELRATVSGKLKGGQVVVAGDQVSLKWVHSSPVIEKLLSRRTLLERKDPGRPQKNLTMAANADLLICILGRDTPRLNHGFIDRCIAAAELSGMDAAVVLNKSDLNQPLTSLDTGLLAEYIRLGYQVVETSTVDGSGVDQLRNALTGKTAVFLGPSGAGKTSLLNVLIPGITARTGAVREDDGRGRHTTSSSRMYSGDGFRLIDLPGIREFGLSAKAADDIVKAFAETSGMTCKFSDCSHSDEPGCGLPGLPMHIFRRESLGKLVAEIEGRSVSDRKTSWQQPPAESGFECSNCGEHVSSQVTGSQHRNHCPRCLHSRHLDNIPGDRTSGCGGIMEPVALWVRKGPEWAIIHRCRQCGGLSSNRIASDDNEALLLSIAVRPLSSPAFPLESLNRVG